MTKNEIFIKVIDISLNITNKNFVLKYKALNQRNFWKFQKSTC